MHPQTSRVTRDGTRRPGGADPLPSSASARIASAASKRKILLVDDHSILREGLATLINQQQDLTVCGEADTVQAALEAIPKQKPDAVIVDISLEGRGGLELIKDIKAQYPQLPTIVLSMHDESLYAERALRAGARGYIMKRQASGNVLTGLRQILDGHYYVSEKISAQLLDQFASRRSDPPASSVDLLSDRELEVYQMIGRGHGTREVARKLNLSVKTVASHRENMKRKLQLSSATELVRNAIHWAKEHQAD